MARSWALSSNDAGESYGFAISRGAFGQKAGTASDRAWEMRSMNVRVAASICLMAIWHPAKADDQIDALCKLASDRLGCKEYLREKKLYENVTLPPGAYYVTSRAFAAEKALRWLKSDGWSITLDKELPLGLVQAHPSDITILIHGFRGVDADISSYFNEFTTLLTSRGSDHIAVVYDWPSIARPYETLSDFERRQFQNLIHPGERYRSMREPEDPLRRGGASDYFVWELSQYRLDQHFAETTGTDGLASLLAEMNNRFPAARINIIAHSMGCFVTEQTLLKSAGSPPGLSKVIWLAPDVSAVAMTDGKLRDQLASLTLVAIFFSRDDEALNLPSRLANGGKRLGAVGFDSDVPQTVKFFDETDQIRRLFSASSKGGSSVHSAFLRVDTGIPKEVIRLLEFK
jgi:hypothetical protein